MPFAIFRSLLLLLWLMPLALVAAQPLAEGFDTDDFEVSSPGFFTLGLTHHVELRCLHPEKLEPYGRLLPIVVNGEKYMANFEDAVAKIPVRFDRREPLSIKVGFFTYVAPVNPMPLGWSIVPPLLVIFLALAFKEVVGALLAGIFSGAMIVAWYASGPMGLIAGFFEAMDGYLVEALYDRGHISVVLFSVVIGGIVALISKNGGMQGVVNAVSRKANTAKSGQLTAWALGIAVFFDDYANTLVVGNTMRGLTDRLRISREKLAYIVDSTAAPVAAVALITTWIGAELGYIEGALSTLDARFPGSMDASPYVVFLQSLQYAYYPVFALALILILILANRDYGPMLQAEQRARTGDVTGQPGDRPVENDEFSPEPGAPLRKRNSVIPIFIVVFGTVTGLLVTGYDPELWADASLGFGQKLSITIGDSDSYKSLIWASVSGLIAAVLLTTGQGIMPYGKSIEVAIDGFKSMVNAVVILILAWALAALTEQMHTAAYLSSLAGERVAPWALPALTFLIAAVVAFSTGSAWGTMAIVYPLMLPLSWELSMNAGLAPEAAMALFFNTTSCVLAGAVLGDHCSPISDTTILSSLATRCDHMAHVRTQLPYALTAGAVALLFTLLSAVLGLPWYINYLLGGVLLVAIVRAFGKHVEIGD